MLFAALGLGALLFAQDFGITPPAQRELDRVNYHRVTSRGSPASEPGSENTPLLPLRVGTADEWYSRRRPELLRSWTAILGKLEPAPQDRKWFGDIRKVYQQSRREEDGYTRIDLDI